MSQLGTVLCSGLFPRLGQEPSVKNGLRAFLVDGNFRPNSGFDGRNFRLDSVRLEEFTPCISFDFERFALSSFESRVLALSERSVGNVVGWPLLKLYYSAFFGAHAILRSRGAGITNLSSADVKVLDQVFQIYFPSSQPIQGGSYFFSVDLTAGAIGEVSVDFEAMDGRGGVHEAFWFYFCRFLDRTADFAVENDLPDAATLLAEVKNLNDLLRDGGGGGIWVTSMRNAINYQHSHEVWMPIRRGSEAGGLLSHVPILPSPRTDRDRKKRPLKAFLDTCIHVAEVNDVIGDFLATRSTRGGAFGQKWRRTKEILK